MKCFCLIEIRKHILSFSWLAIVYWLATVNGIATELNGSEAAALTAAARDFYQKRYSTSGDLAHYRVEMHRKGRNLEITFSPDLPPHQGPNDPDVGGGTRYGLEVTYLVSLRNAKVLDISFWR